MVAGPGGGLLRADDGGAGPGLPVIFVHGLAGSLEMWEPQLAHLRQSRRAVALDLRGHGQSAAADKDDYSMEALGADVLAVADKLGLSKFVLVGHSLGGSVASALAAAHPERVAGLLLVEAAGDLRKAPPEATSALLQALRGAEFETYEKEYARQMCGRSDAVVERMLASAREAQKPALVGWFQGALHSDPLPALAAYAGPKLLIHSGLNDTEYSLPKLALDLPKKLLAAGHCLSQEAPDAFNALLDEFLASLEKPALDPR